MPRPHIAFEELPGSFFSRVSEDLGWRSLFYDDSVVHEDDVICYISGECHLMSYDYHGGVSVGKIADYPEHFPCKFWVESGCGLIEAEDVGL